MFTQNHPSISTSEKSLLISFQCSSRTVFVVILFYFFSFSLSPDSWEQFFSLASLTSNQLKHWRLDALNFFFAFSKLPFHFFHFFFLIHLVPVVANCTWAPKTLGRRREKFVNTVTFLSRRLRSEKLKSCCCFFYWTRAVLLMIFPWRVKKKKNWKPNLFAVSVFLLKNFVTFSSYFPVVWTCSTRTRIWT